MPYDFTQLSSVDFEDLCRDLLGAEFNVTFEAFGPGPDGGIDGRHSRGGDVTILQAKHYAKSSFSTLLSTMKKEKPKVDALSPNRYILATSRSLTDNNKRKLKSALGDHVTDLADILGAEQLNALLRKHPDIETAHIKLWLSSAAVLQKIIHAGQALFTETTQQDILRKLKVPATLCVVVCHCGQQRPTRV